MIKFGVMVALAEGYFAINFTFATQFLDNVKIFREEINATARQELIHSFGLTFFRQIHSFAL